MQKLALRLLLLLTVVLSGSIFAYADGTSARKGVVRVKLQSELATQVGTKARTQTPDGVLATGVQVLDVSTRAIKAKSIRRVFPYAPNHEAQMAEFGLDRWYDITFDESVSVDEALSVLTRTAGVQNAHGIVPMELKENATFRKVTSAPKAATSAMPFNDPRLSAQWHYYNDGSLAQSKAGADINLFEAWNVTTGSDKVTVAIIDGGIDLTHEDLAANIAVNEAELNGVDGADDDGNGYIDDVYGWNFCTNSAVIYPHSHGTHVAGTVAAVNNNGLGVCGVAGGDGTPGTGVKMISVQVFDSRSGVGDADFAAAIVYAANRGATIAQCSWGWASADYVEQSVLDAIDYFTSTARSDNMTGGLCIFAAGNEGSTGNWYPGCYEKVLSVAAMCDDLTPASYSNYGEWVDVVAPGGLMDYGDSHGVLSTLPDNTYGYSEGTSMATPHVSGIAALVLSKYGKEGFVNEVLRQQIVSSVNDFYTPNPSASGLYGSGYVDAAKALVMGDGTAPDAIDSIAVSPAQDNITLEWTVPASSDNNVNNHILYYSTTAFDATSDLSKVNSVIIDTKFLSSGDVAKYELTGLAPLTTYYLALRAVNRWGDASELSPVVSATTNAGPKMTVDKSSLSLKQTATAAVGSATFTIGNTDEGLLKWSGSLKTVSSKINTYSTSKKPFVGTTSYNGKLAIQPYAANTVFKTSDFEAAEYPMNYTYYTTYYATIGEEDNTLPNSAAQWFYVDETKYPNGFNLTGVKFQTSYGTNPTIEVYKGSSVSSTNRLASWQPSYFYSNGIMNLDEQIYFAPGESFWIIFHFPAQENPYTLGLGTADDTTYKGYCYMSNDMGATWAALSDVLAGTSYSSIADRAVWAMTAVSANPDWSTLMTLSPSEGTVKSGETQEVTVANDGQPLCNGTYKFNISFTTNESEANTLKIPVTFTVSGQKPQMKAAKVVDFGSLLVGESKTLSVEVYNEGYGVFGYYGSLSGKYISCNSEHFNAPTYISGGFPARSAKTFDVTYTPQEAGSHSGAITFKHSDGTEFKVYLQGVATDPAKIVIEPDTIAAGDLAVGADAITKEFVIKNEGKYPLEYVFPKFSDNQIEGSTSKAHKFGYVALNNLNGAATFEYDGNPELLGSTDVTSSFTDDNYFSKEIYLGFSFPFYGKSYETVYINSFGGLQFGIGEYVLRSPVAESAYGVDGIPYISAYGYQLQMGPNSKVEYAKQDGKFVVKYSNVLALVYDQEYTPISFRIALSANGDVEVFYDSYDPVSMNLFQGGSTLYCGIKDPEGNDPLTMTSADVADYWGTSSDPAGYVYQYFTNQSSVKFVAPKPNMVTAISAPYGMVGPGESTTITATLAADETMYAGETYNNLVVLSNDPVNGTSYLTITANITGDDLNPAVALENTDINFGNVFRTSDTKVAVTIKNTGKADLTVTEIKAAKMVTFEAEVPFVIEPGMSKDIVVTIPTANEGAIADALTVVTDAGEVTANINGIVIGCPEITLNFTEITETVESGAELKKDLTIANNGNETLVYSITPNSMVSFQDTVDEGAKVSYSYTSASDDSNVTCEWIDIETTGLGEQNNFTYYNNHDFVEVELPFEFPFYGKNYSKMYIYNTGFVSFTERIDQKLWPEPPADFPSGTIYTNIIAPYWGLHTMDTSKTAGTYHYVTEDQAVISWMEYGNTMNMGVCYQLIMKKDGSFKFQYKSYGDYAIIYSIFGLAGISNEDGSEGIKIAERYVSFGNAVEFVPVVESSIATGASKTISLDIDTDKMAGTYTTNLVINTNVPASEKIEIPVNLTVNGTAKPVFPTDTIVIENVMGTAKDEYKGPITAMGAFYEAYFKVANEGTAEFTINNIIVEGEFSIYDSWFDMYYTQPAQLWYYGESTNWYGETTYGWGQYYDSTPVKVGKDGVEFSVPILSGTIESTPGTYDVNLKFCYNENDTVNVPIRFVVTQAPYAVFDKDEIRVEGVTDDYVGTETVKVYNHGQYKLTYELKMDPTGVGEEISEDSGNAGIAPAAKSASVEMPTELLEAGLKSAIIPFESDSLSIYDAPNQFTYNRALYHPAMPGSKTAYTYGAGNTYSEYKTATLFTSPEDGFNISHIYTAFYLGSLSDVDVKVEIVRGSDIENGTVVGTGSFHVSEAMSMGSYAVIPLDRAVFMNPGEEFYVVITYPVGYEYPSFIVFKEEAVISNRYMAYVEGYGWFDLATYFKDTYGSLGHIMSCIETTEGDAWVKLLNETTSGEVAPGESLDLNILISAAKAPLVKGNKAVLVVKSNDIYQPIINFPIYLDKNAAPVISAPTSVVYAKEAATTTVNVVVNDQDGDDFSVIFSDPSALATVKTVTAFDAEAEITTGEDGVISVKNAPAGVNMAVEIAPAYGDAGKYAFTLTATDTLANEAQAIVNYEVEHVNRAPEAIALDDVTIALDGVSPVIEFSSLFNDPDGDDMTYIVAVSDENVVTMFTTETSAIFVGSKVGKAIVDVMATDANGASTVTSFNVVVTEPSGIDENSLNAKVEVYPNPVAETLYVTCDFSAKNVAYAIYSASGAKVYDSKEAPAQGEAKAINVGDLAEGVYILQIVTEDGTATFHVVKK